MKKLPWVIKYRPKRITELVDQDEAKKVLLAWLSQWKRKMPEKKAALLYGPPGCGKTSAVEAIANELGFEVLELNASDYRKGSDIRSIAYRAAVQRSLFGRGKIILLDEVDGISPVADSGALDAILELVKATRNPVIMTANDPWAPQLRPLREVVLMIEFKKLSKTHIIKVLERICVSEKLKCDRAALNYIAERSEGDLRSAINDLQAIAEGYGYVSLELVKTVLRPRDRERNPFDTLRHLFMSKYTWQAKQALMQTDLSYDELVEWLNENIPNQITDIEDLWRAYEALSRADVYLGRIVKSGSWDLLAYAMDLMGPGVALSRKNDPRFRWVKYRFPQKILMLSKTKEVREIREEIATIIGRHLLISKARARTEVLPILRVIFETNPQYAARLALGLGLSNNAIKFLSPKNASVIISEVERLRRLMRKEEGTKRTTRKRKKEKAEGGLGAFLG